MLSAETRIRTRYADTDQMQIVHHAKYFEYFEVARIDLLHQIGLSYFEMERNNYLLPLIECFCNFIKPARFDEVLRIETRLQKNLGPILHLTYKVFNDETNELIAEGFTKHSFVKKDTMKPIRPPQFYLEAIHNSANK